MSFRRSLTPPPVSCPIEISDVEDYRKDPGYAIWWKSQKEKPARLLPPVKTNETMLAIHVAEQVAEEYEEEESEIMDDRLDAGHDLSWTPDEGSISTTTTTTTTRSSLSLYGDMWECPCGTLSHEDYQNCGSCGYPRHQQQQQQQQGYDTIPLSYNPYSL